MEQVLLGIAGASAVGAGNLLQRSSRAVLEPFSDVLHSLANSFSPQDNETTLENVQHEKPLGERIEASLSTAGIEITEPLELTVIDGKLAVVNDHPQRALIEAALAQDPTLVEGLSRLLERSEGSSTLSSVFPSPLTDQQQRIAVFSRLAGEPRLELL
ncbi:hypothetical protein [Bythopirellula goksoeyrii]|uniref:Uncharacterized protein n=1 Tax=Bythopirellula goksoeyrii TaxID=1400387 RepID=A0A5B9Q6X7_9BACT|nr:hypothetical protein [Bythopirellula goksoeyrii]QEG34774.1 hypothetical protein Pr1d_20580 [Bythopirellula goksoeyrii]